MTILVIQLYYDILYSRFAHKYGLKYSDACNLLFHNDMVTCLLVHNFLPVLEHALKIIIILSLMCRHRIKLAVTLHNGSQFSCLLWPQGQAKEKIQILPGDNKSWQVCTEQQCESYYTLILIFFLHAKRHFSRQPTQAHITFHPFLWVCDGVYHYVLVRHTQTYVPSALYVPGTLYLFSLLNNLWPPSPANTAQSMTWPWCMSCQSWK